MLNSSPTLDGPDVATHQLPHADRPSRVQVEVPEYFLRKEVWMRLLAAALLVVFSPIILLAMLLVRMTSAGPALFRQTRVGKDGKLFEVVKIRTMYCDAEDLSGPVLCQPGDSRITPIGRLLRFLHVDELPQLVNVVRGEMCLVGPRPERPEIIARNKLKEKVPGFAERTRVLPGVTGLAQINLPADQTAECVIPKVKLDLEYVATANASLDLRILLCTAMRMLGVRHGRAVKFFGVGRKFSVSQLETFRTSGLGIPQQFHLHVPRPAGTRKPTLAYAAVNGDDEPRPALASKLDEFANEDGVAAIEVNSDFASFPHRPR